MVRVLVLTFLVSFGFCCGFDYKNVAKRTKYDYVVVGAGSAGSVVANQLSKDEEHTVLLLEAGGTPDPMSEVPIFTLQLAKTDMHWKGIIEPQINACQGNPKGRCWWDRGRALGGSSSVNFMSYVRGNKKDFDRWEEAGANGWNYKSVLETFKKIENHTDLNLMNNDFHGTSGYQTVSPLRYTTPIGQAFLNAAPHIGYAYNPDYNGATQQGFSRVQVSERDGLRCSTEKAFLQPASERNNLDILTQAYVRKVTFDDQKRIKSVIFDHQNQTKEIIVGKEVILSAGVISSPTILMHSGIGPKEHLEELKIPVVVDLPGVGQNLQDHAFYSHLSYKINSSAGIVYNRDVNPETIGELLNGKGPMTSPAFVEIVGFINSVYQNRSQDWPDILFFAGSAPIFTVLSMDFSGDNATGICFILLRPKSRGFIKLQSNDPYVNPVVDPRYYSDNDDLMRLIDGTKQLMSIMSSPALQQYNPELTPKVLPGCEKHAEASDQYIECALRRYMMGGNHLAGSCRMGNPNEPNVVLDPELRVKGVSGLRVADASVMPYIVSGNPSAACIMIGQRAADMIRGKSL